MTYQGKTTRNVIVALAATLLLAASALAQDTEIVLHTFTGGKDGAAGGNQLAIDSAGNLYGTTWDGGNQSAACGAYFGYPQYAGCGVVFELSPTEGGTWKETVLHTFTGGRDGALPVGGVVLDSAGNLYGTTWFGGDSKPANCNLQGFVPGCGVVYKLTPTAHGPWKETVLHVFKGGSDGAYPYAGVILDSIGNVYGTAMAGGYMFTCNTGGGGCGVAFELTPTLSGEWDETVLYDFTGGTTGNQVLGRLTFDSQGNLYGVTKEGGDTSASCFGPGYPGCGLVYELTPTPSGPWTETVLHAFTGGADGANSTFGVTLDADGNVYGSTASGGDLKSYSCRQQFIPGCGVVFELTQTQGTWNEQVLYTFTGGGDGIEADSPVTLDTYGNLYGTFWSGGGSGNGGVYKLTPTGQGPWTESELYAFAGNVAGGEPQGTLLIDSSGNLYGMTFYGGNRTECGGNGCGVVFELQP
ncbi:MAG: choice-of-anchor tandem repeat GloVer-containing protein [Terriglobales bacterium]